MVIYCTPYPQAIIDFKDHLLWRVCATAKFEDVVTESVVVYPGVACVCVPSAFIPGVPTCVVAKIYRPIFLDHPSLLSRTVVCTRSCTLAFWKRP